MFKVDGRSRGSPWAIKMKKRANGMAHDLIGSSLMLASSLAIGEG